MRRFIEKSFIILLCLYHTYVFNQTTNLAFYFLSSLIISLALDLLHDKITKNIIYLLFGLTCFYDNSFIYYLPLILYNMYLDCNVYTFFATPLFTLNFSIVNVLISITSIYLSIMAEKFNIILDVNKTTRDGLKEDTLYLKKYNEQLKIDREKNIHIAVLSERNRIARELHDSIGHSISSSILQVEAIKVSLSDKSIIKNLEVLQETLSSGMNDIRESIHNLYHESFDLESKIERLFSKITDIDIKFVYKLESQLDYNLKLDILSVVKEALTNCVKHSDATELNIRLLSQPKFNSEASECLTQLVRRVLFRSMNEIAAKYNGLFNFGYDNGFKIHMVLMKG